jgi:hypothetical protein
MKKKTKRALKIAGAVGAAALAVGAVAAGVSGHSRPKEDPWEQLNLDMRAKNFIHLNHKHGVATSRNQYESRNLRHTREYPGYGGNGVHYDDITFANMVNGRLERQYPHHTPAAVKPAEFKFPTNGRLPVG